MPGEADEVQTRGGRLVAAMRGKATTTLRTDELMELFGRTDEPWTLGREQGGRQRMRLPVSAQE